MLIIILLYALFGTSLMLSKMILVYAEPIFYAGSRMVFGGVLLLGYQYFFAREHFRLKKKHWYWFAQRIFFGIYISYIFRFWALDHMPTFKAAFLFNLSPFLSSLFSYYFFKEIITRKQWVGLIIGFMGLVPIIIHSSPDEASFGEFLFLSWPELALIIAVACHSYSWIIMRKLVRDKSYSPMMVNGVCMAIGGSFAWGTSLGIEGLAPVTNWLPFTLLLCTVVLVSNIICHNIYGFLLRKYTATFMSFAGFMGPLFTAFYSWLFLREVITWHFYVSCVIVFVGLYLFYQDELKNHHFVQKA